MSPEIDDVYGEIAELNRRRSVRVTPNPTTTSKRVRLDIEDLREFIIMADYWLTRAKETLARYDAESRER